MAILTLGDVAIESRETWKSDKENIPIVGLEHLEPGEISLSKWDINSDNTFTKMFRKGQVLLGRRRVYLRKAVIAPTDGICSGDITVIEAMPGKILPELLPFIIQNDRFFNYAMQGSAGSLSPRVKWEHLQAYKFQLPNLEEQKVLADKLWAAYNLKSSYNKLLAATDEMVKSQFIEMFKDAPKTKVKDFCKLNARIGWQGLRQDEFLDTGDYYLVTGVDFKSNRIDWSNCHYVTRERFDQDTNIQLKNDDVLVTKDGTLGKVAIVKGLTKPATLNSGVFVIRDVMGLTTNTFMYYALLSKDFENFIEDCKTGSTIAHLNQKAFYEYQFPTPAKELQNKFVAIAEQADKSKFELRKSIESIDAVIKSLINS